MHHDASYLAHMIVQDTNGPQEVLRHHATGCCAQMTMQDTNGPHREHRRHTTAYPTQMTQMDTDILDMCLQYTLSRYEGKHHLTL